MMDDPFETKSADVVRLRCHRCAQALYPGRGNLYVVSILAVADPFPPVFTAEDLAGDLGSEIRRLIQQASGLEAQEAQDQVYRRRVFHLCISCYRAWIEDPTGSKSYSQG